MTVTHSVIKTELCRGILSGKQSSAVGTERRTRMTPDALLLAVRYYNLQLELKERITLLEEIIAMFCMDAAAMRCYVESKLGTEVEVPDELA